MIRAEGRWPGGTWASSRERGMSTRVTGVLSLDWKRIDEVVEEGGAGEDDGEDDDVL